MIFADLTGRLVAEYSSGSPQNNGTRYLTSDNLGSPRLITDANGTVTARHDYHSFGEEVGLKGGRSTSDPLKYVADNVRRKFTSKERDQETQLDFFEARYYASTEERFTSVDPQLASGKRSKPQTCNRYSYALNNPYRYTDPEGEDATENPELFLRRTTTTTKVIVQDQDGRGNVTQQAAAHKRPDINRMQLSGGKGKVDLRFNIAGAIDVFNANSASTNTLNQRLQDYNFTSRN